MLGSGVPRRHGLRATAPAYTVQIGTPEPAVEEETPTLHNRIRLVHATRRSRPAVQVYQGLHGSPIQPPGADPMLPEGFQAYPERARALLRIPELFWLPNLTQVGEELPADRPRGHVGNPRRILSRSALVYRFDVFPQIDAASPQYAVSLFPETVPQPSRAGVHAYHVNAQMCYPAPPAANGFVDQPPRKFRRPGLTAYWNANFLAYIDLLPEGGLVLRENIRVHPRAVTQAYTVTVVFPDPSVEAFPVEYRGIVMPCKASVIQRPDVGSYLVSTGITPDEVLPGDRPRGYIYQHPRPILRANTATYWLLNTISVDETLPAQVGNTSTRPRRLPRAAYPVYWLSNTVSTFELVRQDIEIKRLVLPDQTRRLPRATTASYWVDNRVESSQLNVEDTPIELRVVIAAYRAPKFQRAGQSAYWFTTTANNTSVAGTVAGPFSFVVGAVYSGSAEEGGVVPQ